MKVSRLRRLVILETIYPALTHGAKLCCAYGAEKHRDWKRIFFVGNSAEGAEDTSPPTSPTKFTRKEEPTTSSN